MRLAVFSGLLTLLLQSSVIHGAPVCGLPEPSLNDADIRILQELGPLLSDDAVINTPSTAHDGLLARASFPRINPGYAAVVEVGSESDVQETINYANLHQLPFLAISGAHGWPVSMNSLDGGIQINMRKLNSSSVDADGKTATVGGGILQYELNASLFKQGKQAVIGLCECVSVIGPILGGGHSLLQGRHGFSADNLVSARVVLADGTAVSASASENPDLFWALRGAGHNFGVVTSFQVTLYDVQTTWSIAFFSFTQDKLELFFETWNRLETANQNPGALVLAGVIMRNNDLDTSNPVINLEILYEDDNSVGDTYTAAFEDIGPAFQHTVKGISWGDLHEVGGFGLSGPICVKDHNIVGFPNSFDTWDPAAMRKAFGTFKEFTDKPTFNSSAWLIESYGREGVNVVDPSESAVSPEERNKHILTAPMWWWAGDDARDRETAITYGQKIRRILRAEEDAPHSYVNYALGGEDLVEMYGRDFTRISKLKGLKKTWDPQNRFRFYNPIE